MLIKFKKPDPRAGMIARMDSSRGQQLIDAGAADQEDEGPIPAPAPEKVGIEIAQVDPMKDPATNAPAVPTGPEPEVAKPKSPRGKK